MADVQNISLSATCAERTADLVDGIEAATFAAGQAREFRRHCTFDLSWDGKPESHATK